jgi:hypothetical protein
VQEKITINFQNEEVTVETVTTDNNLQFRVNFDHPVFVEKDVDGDGVQIWKETGAGETLRAAELGELIDKHLNS